MGWDGMDNFPSLHPCPLHSTLLSSHPHPLSGPPSPHSTFPSLHPHTLRTTSSSLHLPFPPPPHPQDHLLLQLFGEALSIETKQCTDIGAFMRANSPLTDCEQRTDPSPRIPPITPDPAHHPGSRPSPGIPPIVLDPRISVSPHPAHHPTSRPSPRIPPISLDHRIPTSRPSS